MKFSAHVFRRLWDLHAWMGMLTSLLLHIMIVCGAITLFYGPLSTWGDPLGQRSAPFSSQQGMLEAFGPRSPDFYLYLPDDAHGLPKVLYVPSGSEDWEHEWLTDAPGGVLPERERLAGFLYDLHFLWHRLTPDLELLAGFLAVALLVASVTGLAIHLKDLRRQFFQVRANRGPRVLWSDLHKVIGVMTLPFQLVYAYTGALMVLAPVLLSNVMEPVFGGDAQRAIAAAGQFAEELLEEAPKGEPGRPAAMLPLDKLSALAVAAEPRLRPDSFLFTHYGYDRGTVDVRGTIVGTAFADRLTRHSWVRLGLTDGRVLDIEAPGTSSASSSTWRWIQGFHLARYGGTAVRALLFALALLTSLVILTGNWIWIERRKARADEFGDWLLQRLTAGIGAGLFVAIAALFVASRVFPLDWAARGDAEVLVFVTTLGGCVLLTLFIDPRRAWGQLLGSAGLLLSATPVLATRMSPAGLFGSGPRLNEVVAVDVGLLLLALLLLAAAWGLLRRSPTVAPSTSLSEPAPLVRS